MKFVKGDKVACPCNRYEWVNMIVGEIYVVVDTSPDINMYWVTLEEDELITKPGSLRYVSGPDIVGLSEYRELVINGI